MRNFPDYSYEEEILLRKMVRAGWSKKVIAAQLNREYGDIRQKMALLGLKGGRRISTDATRHTFAEPDIDPIAFAERLLKPRVTYRNSAIFLDGKPCNLTILMTTANQVLHSRGMPQIGKNKDWWVDGKKN